MRHVLRVMPLAAALTAAIACGTPPAQQQAEQAAKEMEKAGQELAKAGEELAKAGASAGADAAKAGGSFAQAMQQMAGAMNGSEKAVDPVSFKALMPLLPLVDGWTQSKPTGEKMNVPVAFSKSEASYTRDKATVTVELMDSGFNKIVFAPFMMMMATGYEKETSSGYEKATKIAGHPAFEKWDGEAREGETTVLVANRFVVKVEGRHLDDMKSLHAFVNATDLTKLAALK